MQLQSALSIKLPATSHQMGATLAKEQFGDATKLERFGNIFVLRHSVSLSKMLCFLMLASRLLCLIPSPTSVPNGTINCVREVFSFILQGTLVSKLYSSGISSGHSPRCYLALLGNFAFQKKLTWVDKLENL